MDITQRTAPSIQAKLPPLLLALWYLLEEHRPAFRQERPFRRMQALLLGHLFGFARRTVTQALVAVGLTDCDWSAFYRLFNEPGLDYGELADWVRWQTWAYAVLVLAGYQAWGLGLGPIRPSGRW